MKNNTVKMMISALAALALFAGCTKNQAEANAESNKEMEVAAVNPELSKVDYVLSMMSERFQREITIADKEEFLSDLHAVLDAEKTYRSDDLELYYLIDKKHNIGSDYEPKDLKKLVKNDYYNISRNDLSLRPDVEEALVELSKAALQDDLKLMVSSTYRSYAYQERLFQKWVDIDGLEEAERESARAGTSQHQLGVAIDFGSIDDSFAETRMGKWLNSNAMKYGWSLSFPQEYEDITGYRWECWHFRYIGVPACRFQYKYFNNVQQYMLEFIDAWKKTSVN